MKKLIQLFSILFLLVSCSKQNLKPVTVQTSNGSVTYHVEVADTLQKMQKGLMYRKNLKIDSGMIFLFDDKHPQPISMWMQNTFISLDMLFVDSKNTIIGIAQNTKPLSTKTIRPTLKPSAYVIELNAGEVQKHNIKIGDKILF